MIRKWFIRCCYLVTIGCWAATAVMMLTPHPWYDSQGYIDDGHGHPGNILHQQISSCTGFGDFWEWAPNTDGTCHLTDAGGGHRYFTPQEIADSVAPTEDLKAALLACEEAIERAKKFEGITVDAVQLNGRDFLCRPFRQN